MGKGGIRAGDLNRKIALYREVRTEDSSGQATKAFTFDFYMMANPRPLRAMERTKSDREEMATLEFAFITHFKKELSTTHKIKFDGNFFDIVGIAPMGANSRRFIEIYAQLLDQTDLVFEG